MVLYTCAQKKAGPALMHPCAKAAQALDAAGHEYEVKAVKGYRFVPWTRPSRGADRAEVRELSGKNEVPILVLDGGGVVSGSGEIAQWAREHPVTRAAPGTG